jgi:hypothetical protein
MDDPCERERCVQNRVDLDAAMDHILELESKLRRGGGGGDTYGDDSGRVFELEQEAATLRDANSRLHDELDRFRERDTSSRQQIQDMQRELRQAVAARSDAEESVSRMQTQIAGYERELARWVQAPRPRGMRVPFGVRGPRGLGGTEVTESWPQSCAEGGGWGCMLLVACIVGSQRCTAMTFLEAATAVWLWCASGPPPPPLSTRTLTLTPAAHRLPLSACRGSAGTDLPKPVLRRPPLSPVALGVSLDVGGWTYVLVCGWGQGEEDCPRRRGVPRPLSCRPQVPWWRTGKDVRGRASCMGVVCPSPAGGGPGSDSLGLALALQSCAAWRRTPSFVRTSGTP